MTNDPFNPIHRDTDSNGIYMMALIRYSDKTVVASISFNQASHIGRISVEGVRECVAGSAATLQPGKRLSAQGDSFCIHYQLDGQVRIFKTIQKLSNLCSCAYLRAVAMHWSPVPSSHLVWHF